MATSETAFERNKLPQAEIGDRSVDAILGANPFVCIDPTQILAAASRLVGRALMRPRLLAEQAGKLAGELGRILLGRSEVAPPAGDRRFADFAWQYNPFYRRLMQAYLVSVQGLHEIGGQVGFDELSARRADFAISLLTDALAPTNFLFSNPAALKRAFDTAGLSLLKGAGNRLEDIRHNGGMPSQVDGRPFKVGKTLAVSPGSVVHRTELFELIQYSPRTEAVHARPLLLVPPQINKFYIFDLASGRSVVEYLVNHGHQPFMMSWHNPTPSQRDWDLAAYVRAAKEAIEVVLEVTGSQDLNILGACAGGVTTAILLAHLAALGDSRVNCATFLVTVLDTSVPSLIGIFASEKSIALARRHSAKRGILPGQELARGFAWLRANDLVWSYWVNNYLMGNDPPAFDILVWNNDSTNLPAAFHSDILTIFEDNPLVKPGALNMLGTPIDLSRVGCDSYVVGALTDHITPWKACYRSASLLGGKSQFVLSSSGHIQAMVNPPGNPKARYLTGGDGREDADSWLKHATQQSGTWWDHWRVWLDERAGEMRKAPEALGSPSHPAIAPAPGSYVFE